MYVRVCVCACARACVQEVAPGWPKPVSGGEPWLPLSGGVTSMLQGGGGCPR